MSRLADRILQSVRPPTGATVDPRWLQSDRELLAQSEVIVFDNVNDFFWAHLPEHKAGPCDDQSVFMNNLVGGSRLGASNQRRRVDELFLYVAPALLAISFLHCKNVEITVDVPPTPLSPKHTKRYGRPLIRYHVLNIRPMRTILRKEGKIETEGLEKALHICRGHFKDYRTEGFFGKYKGIFGGQIIFADTHARVSC